MRLPNQRMSVSGQHRRIETTRCHGAESGRVDANSRSAADLYEGAHDRLDDQVLPRAAPVAARSREPNSEGSGEDRGVLGSCWFPALPGNPIGLKPHYRRFGGLDLGCDLRSRQLERLVSPLRIAGDFFSFLRENLVCRRGTPLVPASTTSWIVLHGNGSQIAYPGGSAWFLSRKRRIPWGSAS